MTQCEAILSLLVERKEMGCTAADFNQFPPRGLGIPKYTNRISELKRLGWIIECVAVEVGHEKKKLNTYFYRGRKEDVDLRGVLKAAVPMMVKCLATPGVTWFKLEAKTSQLELPIMKKEGS